MKSTTKSAKTRKIFTDEELEAIKDAKSERRGGSKGDGEHDVLAKIAEMTGPDRELAERIHAIVKASAPTLSPKTWYGMPAYAKDGKVVCFFQSAQKFKSRYATFGFSDAAKLDEPESIVPIRTDDVRQCLFAVTRHPDLQNYGELAAVAPQLRFLLPPQESSSAGTFEILQQVDADGVGRAKSIEHAPSADEAIRTALSGEGAVAFFVQFPDPGDARFKLVRELGGYFVPIVDREILRQVIDGQKVYFAQETQVSNADWLTRSQKVVTACTPMVLFTGSPDKIADPKARQDHQDLIATIRALRTEALLPQDNTFARVLARTKDLSATSAEKLMRASERAREKAQPKI